jgi:hypothetical protein
LRPERHDVERHDMVASALDLPAYPVGSGVHVEMDGVHIMGAVALSWLTCHPVRRWGEAWAHRGTMTMRYRAHLTVGTPLHVLVTHGAALGLEVVNDRGVVCADGSAGLAGEGASDDPPPFLARSSALVLPMPAALKDLPLNTLELDFDADRDLAYVSGLADRDLWLGHGWAHPAWAVSGVNAMLRRSIAFTEKSYWADLGAVDGYWIHAGSQVALRGPIRSGSHVLLSGRVERLFAGKRHRFAVAAVNVVADGAPAALVRSTFVYGAASPHS